MKKFTFLWGLLLCLSATLSAQDLRPSSSTMDDLLHRYSQVGNQAGSVSDFFTASEQQLLRNHLNNRVLPVPSPQIAALLDRLDEVGISAGMEAAGLFTDYERGLLNRYYAQAYDANNQRSAPGDVYALNLRVSCGNDFGIFPLAGPYNIAPITTITTSIFAGDLDGSGTLYALDNTALTLLTIDKTTGAETTVGPLTNIVPGDGTRGLAWNEADGTMYMMGGQGENASIYSVNLATGELTLVSTANVTGWLPIWLAIDNNGNAFMADIALDNLYSVNLATGAATLVGPLGVNINFAQDADFDPDTNTLYMAAYLGGGVNQFCSVNTATGAATSLGSVNADCAEVGIVAIEGTTIVPPGSGLAYGALTFPAPEMFINFDPTTPDVLNNVGPAGTVGPNFEGSGAIDPANPTTATVVNNVGGIFSLDITTGTYTSLGNVGLPGGLNGLEYNPVDGVLYGVDGTTLYTVDPSVPSATAVGPLGSAGLAIALAINGAGEAYTYDIVDDNSYSINLATGAATLLGPTGFDGNFGQGMTWDPNTDTIYLAAFNNGAFLGEWRSFNTATGATTLLGVLGGTTPGGTNQVAWASIPGSGPAADNDDCANATEVSCGNTYLGDTSDNTDQGGFDTSPDEWFEFTGTGSFEFVTISLCDGGTGFDSRLTVFDACGGAQVATNDDFCGLQSELTFTSNGTSTYYIAVEGFGGATGAFSMAVSCVPAPPPPSNDLCANAIAVSCGDFISGTTIDATIDSAVAPLCDTGVTSPGVWYVLTDNTGLVTDITITMCTGTTDYDAKLSVYTGDCGAPPLTCVVGNDDTCGLQSEVSFQSDGNTTFLILVHGFGGATGNFELDIQCTPIPPPNDEIANSIDVDEIGCPYTDPAVAMPAATSEAGGTPAGCDNAGARGVWYNFTPTTDGTASASIQNQPTPQVNLIVNNGPLAGYYAAVPASFGGTLTTFPLTQDTAVVIDDNSGGGTDENDACDPVTNGGALAGKIAIVRRGSCEFGAKALAAEMAGAIAVIVVNNNPDPPIVMGGGAVGDQVTIPAVMVADVFWRSTYC
ncbi:PA domain-containing protein [Ulvibacter sp. MAR_2010_11]|uniref:PA domain-containing protein n=1 Tax=Ulvibacter sp. MAR_2010_11 TaxID=1250229 RepID=UPI000C2CD07B|nr:PA domain-containing protein [Ulvibacter sp. MAR_2010_11]PKA81889.1 PA domain-containing protein [Ulvibacter sp. MAR_2010_11]